MRHLTVDEIIDFVSMDQINAETLQLASTVNAHIGKCEKCLRRVRAFQLLYDEFVRLGKANCFETAIRSVEENQSISISPTEICETISNTDNENDSISLGDEK